MIEQMTTGEKKTFQAFIGANIVGVLGLIGSIFWFTYSSGTVSASEQSKTNTEISNLKERLINTELSVSTALNRNQTEHDKLSDKLDEVKTLIMKQNEKK